MELFVHLASCTAVPGTKTQTMLTIKIQSQAQDVTSHLHRILQLYFIYY